MIEISHCFVIMITISFHFVLLFIHAHYKVYGKHWVINLEGVVPASDTLINRLENFMIGLIDLLV